MKSALRWTISAFLLTSFSCSSTLPPPLPPPGPPAPLPPEAGAPGTQAKAEQHLEVPPAPVRIEYRVAVFRWENERRTQDGENTTRLLNLLAHNQLPASKAASLSADLPPAFLDAALAAAGAQKQAGGSGDVFILGEVKPLQVAQVRLAAVDLRSMKVIDNFGNEGSRELTEKIFQTTLEQLLGSVERYFARR